MMERDGRKQGDLIREQIRSNAKTREKHRNDTSYARETRFRRGEDSRKTNRIR